MGKQAHVELSVDIQVPAQQVWDAITDWESQDKWMLGTHVVRVPGTGPGVGERIEAFTGLGKIGFLDTMEITRWEPPFRCDVIHTGRVVRGTGTFEVVAINDNASKFIWSEDLDLPLGPLGAAGFAVLRPAFLQGVKKSLEKFADLLERGQL